MKKRWTGKIVLLVLIGLFVFGIVMIVSNNKKQDRRNRAASLFHQKRYEESLAIWEEWEDENAERWQEKCRLEIINQKIKDLMENEKAAEALDMLYKEYPESPLIGEVIFARAKELVGQNKPEEALALMQTIEAPDVECDRYKKDCEAAVAIKQFRAYMEEGEYSKAYKTRKPSVAGAIMGSYWSILAVAYLTISFLTNAWDKTWIIFVLGGVLHPIISAIVLSARNKKDNK